MGAVIHRPSGARAYRNLLDRQEASVSNSHRRHIAMRQLTRRVKERDERLVQAEHDLRYLRDEQASLQNRIKRMEASLFWRAGSFLQRFRGS